MIFRCNNAEWEIKEVDKKDLELRNVLGETDYDKQEIRIWNECKNKIRTLKHELCHVWLWENAQTQTDDRKYEYEEICEIVACSNDFINLIVSQYIEYRKLINEFEVNNKCHVENKTLHELSEEEQTKT